MKLAVTAEEAAGLPADLLALGVFEGSLREDRTLAAIDTALGGALFKSADDESFKGKKLQFLSIHTLGKLPAARVLLVGLGNRKDFASADLRLLGARASRVAAGIAARRMVVGVTAEGPSELAVRFAAEGVELGRYRFDRYLAEDKRQRDKLEEVTLAVGAHDARLAAAALARAEAVTTAVARTRDWVNEPAAVMTPQRLAELAGEIAKQAGLELEVLGPAACEKLGMGMFLAVSKGSPEEPRFIHLTYRPKTVGGKRVVLIGKGVTFDSGGLSLKPSQGMEDMKTDMTGAATVISTIGALAALGVPHEVHAIAACTENMIGGKAYKLGDVLRSMSGKTVEINNTDAEGRLTLGDAISFASALKPDEMIDFATLTGACVVALGPHIAGVMSNHPGLSERWLKAAKAAGEDMWPLPLPERLREQLKSELADMRNTGERWGGALTAGLFLKEFVGDIPWVHVNLAGPSSADKEYGHVAKGGTGFAVATIVEYLAS